MLLGEDTNNQIIIAKASVGQNFIDSGRIIVWSSSERSIWTPKI